MALVFPLSLNDFFNGLPIGVGSVDLTEAMEMSENGKGEILTASMGNRLWKADFDIASCTYEQADAIKARLDTLRYPGRSLLVRPAPYVGPRNDRDGQILTPYDPKIYAVASNNREITFSALPVGLLLEPGDFFGYLYGSNPVRRALHQITVGGTVGSDGRVTVESSSFILPGYSLGSTSAIFLRPVFKAVIVPGSVNPGRKAQQRVEGLSFSLMQTFR